MGTDTHSLLVRCTVADPAVLARAASDLCTESALRLTLDRAAWSPESTVAYAYARLPQPAPVSDAQLAGLAALWQRLCPAARGSELSRLALLFDAPGHSQGATAQHHYIVETDAESGWMDEIDRWYDTEHMPGLAAVPGCIHARRLRNLDRGPASLACYDLVTPDTLGSPPWLAVRGTAWSDRARPHFINTRRTMLRVVA